jgi:RNA polymerase sigma factor (sigma-70 family)
MFLKHPGITDTPESIEAFVDKQIATRTAKLKQVMSVRKLSCGDIRQEFLLAIIEAMSRFDSTKGTWRTYISKVCNNRYCELRRKYSTEINSLGNVTQLDVLNENETDVIPTYEVDFETQADVSAVLSKIPANLLKIAELLKTNSPAQTASHLGVSRSTISRAIKRIREYFLANGFEKLHGDATN